MASATELFNVDGLVALVTGGGTGIGLMTATALAKNGAKKVYIAGRRLEVLQAAAESLGTNVIPVRCDVTSKDSLKEAAEFVEKDSGHLNLLVCNSGVTGPAVAPVRPDTTLDELVDNHWKVDFDEYTNTFAVNASAVWFTTMAFLKLLDKGNKAGSVEQSSQVIVTSSIAGFNKKAPGGYAYGQSKAAATHLVKQLSVLLLQWNMRANCVAPGLFPSEMTAGPFEKNFPGSTSGKAVIGPEHVPVRRMGNSTEMGGTMLYLASKAGGYNNGEVIVIDGGRLLQFPSVH